MGALYIGLLLSGSVGFGILFWLLAEYLRLLARKSEQERLHHTWWALQGMSRTFVLAAEELYDGDEQTEKREYVLRRLQEMLDQNQMTLELEQLEAMLESTVAEIKLELAGRAGPPDVFS
jgi:hypothetical protein